MNTNFFEKAMRVFFIFVAIVIIIWASNKNAMAQDPVPVKVGLVIDENGVADMAFNWMANQGLMDAENNLGIDGTLYESVSPDDYEPLLQQCADDGNELCFAVGFMMDYAVEVAATWNPGTAFAILDASKDSGLSNLRGIRFDEKEIGYLAGALAGKMTGSNAVGVVGGWPIQPVVDFAEGYRNGAQCTDPDLVALIQYINDWNDPELGSTTAQDMINQGADVIFAAAGATGNGAILYSAGQEVWSIGVDVDQYLTTFENGTVPGSDYLLTSAMKKLNFAVYKTIEDYLDGVFSAGTVTYHLSDGGVGLAPFHEADASILIETKDYVNSVEIGISSGAINIHDDCRPIGSPAHPIKIFFTPSVDTLVILEGGAVMAEYLNLVTDLSFEVIVPSSHPDTVLKMCASPDDSIGFFPGIGYVLAHDLCGADVSYKAIRYDWDVYWSEILIARDGPFENIAQLNGLTWAIPSYSSLSGYLVPLAMWSNAGIMPGEIIEVGGHQQAVMAVYNGDVDFATAFFSPPIKPETEPPWQPGDDPDIPDDLVQLCGVTPDGNELVCDGWRVMDARISIRNEVPDVVQTLEILDISDQIANDAFAFGPGFPADLRSLIEDAMVAFAGSEGWWNSIGRSDFYNWSGLSPAMDADYDPTREIVVAAGITLENWGQPPVEYYPSFSARITDNQVHGYGWLLDSEVTLFIDGEEIGTQTVTQADGDPNETFVWFDIGETLTLQGDQFIEMTDGNVTKTHTVTNLVVYGADPDMDTVFGTANVGTQVEIGHIWCDEHGCYGFRRVEADASGNWLADFSVVGEDPDEQDLVDILPGMGSDARQCDEDGDCTNYGWHVPNPHFTVLPVWDSVELWEWPEGVFVTATVSGKPECNAEGYVEGSPWGTYLRMNFPEYCDVVVDNVVTLEAEGILTQTHEVRYLTVMGPDAVADTVAGTADVGEIVYVWPHEEGGYEVEVMVDGAGDWLADFGGGFDIMPGMNGRAEVRDVYGNATAVDWHVPNPHFTVYPEWESVEAWDWPDGVEVTASVEGKPDCITEGTAAYPEWDPSTTNVWMDFSDGCDVASGDLMTLTADGVDPVTYMVQNLAITEVNAEADIVTGTADPGEMVYLWPHCCGEFEVTPVAVDGMWLADFGAVGFDLAPGTDGRAEVRDDYGNATAIDWRIPNPIFSVRANDDWIEGQEWPLDATLTIEVDDPSTQADPDHTAYGVPVFIPEWDPNTTWFELNLQNVIDIQAGFEITATDGTTTKFHQVTNLSFNEIDLAADIVYGTATPDSWISVWTCDEYNCVTRSESVNPAGEWEADFSVPGDEEWESEIFDIQPGTWVDSEQQDEDGDRTIYGQSVPYPRINANITDEWIWMDEFPSETPFTVAIYESYEAYLDGAPPVWDDDIRITEPDGTAYIDFWPDFVDLTPDMYVVVSSGQVTKDIVLEPISMFVFDLEADLLAGSAPPDRLVWVEVGNEYFGCDMWVMSEPDGLWTADFSSQPCDITEDMGAGANVYDEDGDATVASPGFPQGSHDYDTGDVPGFACNAGGWAVDPDDRERAVPIRVFSDGEVIVSDLATNGDGNDGYEAHLWGLIDSYETHEIAVEAYDLESETWFALENTPRILTCRTYDIYAYDPLTGTTTQITNLMDANEFNPSWSPNGKLVAHDVLMGDSQDIYITDIKTGISTPLLGAKGGNDAAWSQNGRWIAFDRMPMGDTSLYIVTSEGGAATLVRENGVSADWAPNGKRLVFQDTTDGSIRTVPVDGGKGDEIVIAANGANPSWSPDGNWIAYDHEGDIWKVQVNVQGTVFSAPIQVTSGFFDDRQPTWSADNSTIIYHSGIGRDYDLWSVPAAGGEATWFTGAFEFGDFTPEIFKEGTNVAYASFSPNGQTSRDWVAFFSYNLPEGTWAEEGLHTYYYEWEQGPDGGRTDDVTFNVSLEAEEYEEVVLLRPRNLIVNAQDSCHEIDTIHPDQNTSFNIGWRQIGTYPEVLAFYDSMVNRAVWDGGSSTDFVRHEVFPRSSEADISGYICSIPMP